MTFPFSALVSVANERHGTAMLRIEQNDFETFCNEVQCHDLFIIQISFPFRSISFNSVAAIVVTSLQRTTRSA